MGLATISEYSATVGRGMRANKYRVLLALPAGVDGDARTFSILVRATSVPAKESGVIDTQYKGKVVKSVGDSNPIEDWTVTAHLEDASTAATAKKIADSWQKLAQDSKDPSVYKSIATIEILGAGEDETTLLKYKLDGVWISNSGTIDLGDETTDEIATLELTFNLDDITPIS